MSRVTADKRLVGTTTTVVVDGILQKSTSNDPFETGNYKISPKTPLEIDKHNSNIFIRGGKSCLP